MKLRPADMHVDAIAFAMFIGEIEGRFQPQLVTIKLDGCLQIFDDKAGMR